MRIEPSIEDIRDDVLRDAIYDAFNELPRESQLDILRVLPSMVKPCE